MKRKMIIGTLLLTILLILLPAVVFANDTITVTTNGQAVVFADQAPVIIDGRTLVPVAGVFQALGFETAWDGNTQQVTIAGFGNVIVITIDSTTFTTNGANHSLDVPAQIINGRTMLPIASVLRTVGFEVGWDDVARTVAITSAAAPVAVPEPLPEPVDVYEPEPALEPITEPEPTPELVQIGYIISAPTQARRNETLTITFQGEPNTQYYLRIVSAAGNVLTADGLGNTTSDANGVASWTWLVGGRTGAGSQPITITGGGKTVRHEITIIVD